ncbi:MAG TPA: hypothetical protein PK511_09835 [Chitinophagales bacterium]|nr:hypothetical protein [Chitinophagales bacterium]
MRNLILFAFLALLMTSCADKSGSNKKQADEEKVILPDVVTFNEHIAPIIFENCTPCHRPHSAGPFPFTTYDEIKAKAKTISKVTQSRFMPPWPADPSYTNFKGERILTVTEIAMIKKWVEDDCPVGDVAKIPAVPHYPEGSQIGTPDLVINFPDFTLEGNNKDHFFLVKVPFEIPEDKYVKTIEFIPGNKKLAHHMNANLIEYQPGKKKTVFNGKKIIPTNLAESADVVQTEMDNKNDDGTYPVLVPLVCNYLPGVSPAMYPEGIGGFRMTKQGTFFINDFHFGPTPKDAIDTSSHFNIFFDDKPPVRPTYEILLGSLGVAPVTPALVIPPNEVKTFTIDYQVQETMSLLTVNPHMHLLGKSFLAYAVTPQSDTIPLIRINKWDFRWQYFYTFKSVVVIPGGSRIHVEAVFDNTVNNVNNPYYPPQVIIDRGDRFDSMKTTNEMLQLILTYMEYQSGDEYLSLE